MHLKFKEGELIQWSLNTMKEDNNLNSLYHNKKRMHVISFDNLNEESDPLMKDGDIFQFRFKDVGTFKYHCSIYTRMRGTIEVIEDKDKKAIRPKQVKKL